MSKALSKTGRALSKIFAMESILTVGVRGTPAIFLAANIKKLLAKFPILPGVLIVLPLGQTVQCLSATQAALAFDCATSSNHKYSNHQYSNHKLKTPSAVPPTQLP